MIIQAIKNQLKLRPQYYREVSIVSGVGCLIGMAIFYPMAGAVFEYFEINTDVPIRKMDSILVATIFIASIFGFAIILTICSIAMSFAYFSLYCIGGSLSIEQVKSMTLRGRYPQHWYKKGV